MISQISDISNRDGHATDEEKLASTSCGQKSAGAEVKGEPGGDLGYCRDCSNVPMSVICIFIFRSRHRSIGTLEGPWQGTVRAQICTWFFSVRDTEILSAVLGTDTGRSVEGAQGMATESLSWFASVRSVLEWPANTSCRWHLGVAARARAHCLGRGACLWRPHLSALSGLALALQLASERRRC